MSLRRAVLTPRTTDYLVRRSHQAWVSIAPSLVVQASLVLSGVLSARLLGPELRGHLTLAALLPGVVAAVAYVGLANALAYFTARDPTAAHSLLAGSLKLGIPFAIVALVANLLLLLFLFGADEPEIRAAAGPSILVAPALVIQAIAAAHLQGLTRYQSMNVLRVAPYAIYAVGVSICFLMQEQSLALVIWVYTVAYGSVALAGIVIIRRALVKGSPTVQPVAPRTLLRFGVRGSAVSLSPIETFRADQLLVGAVLSAAELAFYSVATAFSVLPRLLTQSLGLVGSAEVAASPPARRRASVRGFLITAVLLVVSTVIAIEALLPALITFLLGDAFLPAVAGSRLLVLAAGVLGLRRLVTDLGRGLGMPGGESVAEIASWPFLFVGAILIVSTGTRGGGIEAMAAVVLVASTISLIVALAHLSRAMRLLREADDRESSP